MDEKQIKKDEKENSSELDNETIKDTGDNTLFLSKAYRRMFRFIEAHPFLTQEAYSNALNISVRTIQKLYEKCREVGVNIDKLVGKQGNLTEKSSLMNAGGSASS